MTAWGCCLNTTPQKTDPHGAGPGAPQTSSFYIFFVKIDRLYKSMTYSVFVTVVIEDRVCLPFCYIFFFFFFFFNKR
jgi:hypothetical protein